MMKMISFYIEVSILVLITVLFVLRNFVALSLWTFRGRLYCPIKHLLVSQLRHFWEDSLVDSVIFNFVRCPLSTCYKTFNNQKQCNYKQIATFLFATLLHKRFVRQIVLVRELLLSIYTYRCVVEQTSNNYFPLYLWLKMNI